MSAGAKEESRQDTEAQAVSDVSELELNEAEEERQDEENEGIVEEESI